MKANNYEYIIYSDQYVYSYLAKSQHEGMMRHTIGIVVLAIVILQCRCQILMTEVESVFLQTANNHTNPSLSFLVQNCKEIRNPLRPSTVLQETLKLCGLENTSVTEKRYQGLEVGILLKVSVEG